MRSHGIAFQATLLGHIWTIGIKAGHSLGEVMRPHGIAVKAALLGVTGTIAVEPGHSRGIELCRLVSRRSSSEAIAISRAHLANSSKHLGP